MTTVKLRFVQFNQYLSDLEYMKCESVNLSVQEGQTQLLNLTSSSNGPEMIQL